MNFGNAKCSPPTQSTPEQLRAAGGYTDDDVHPEGPERRVVATNRDHSPTWTLTYECGHVTVCSKSEDSWQPGKAGYVPVQGRCIECRVDSKE